MTELLEAIADRLVAAGRAYVLVEEANSARPADVMLRDAALSDLKAELGTAYGLVGAAQMIR